MLCCWPMKLFAIGGVAVSMGGGLFAANRLHFFPALVIVAFVLCVAWCASAPAWLRHSVREHQRKSSWP